jgi:hypothetical protein
VLRCDEFIRRWPGNEKVEDANFIRMALTAEPSPEWIRAKGGTGPGKAFVAPSTLLSAAESEASRRIAAGQLASAYRHYDMFLSKMGQTVPAEYQADFREQMGKKKIYVEQKAQAEFEMLDEKAMVLEDRRDYEKVEDLYRDARERLGIGEIVTRCNGQLERLKELKRK